MENLEFALCVKLSDANASDVIAATRRHKVAILHVENYNFKKDYTNILREYPLAMPENSRLSLLFVLPNGESFIADTNNLPAIYKNVTDYLLNN